MDHHRGEGPSHPRDPDSYKPLRAKRPVRFQITDWYIPEADKANRQIREKENLGWDNSKKDYEVFMFGCTEDGASITVQVTGFRPYFYVKAPPEWWDLSKQRIREKVEDLRNTMLNGWTDKRTMDRETKKMKEYRGKIIPKRLEDHLEAVRLVRRKDFMGFTNGREFPFIQVQTRSLALFNMLKRYFQDRKKDGFVLYESNIDPFLRFIHEQNIDPCGWVEIAGGEYEIVHQDDDDNDASPAQSSCSGSEDGDPYTPLKARTIHSIRTMHSSVKPYQISRIAPLLIASFDIECTSSHGDFPVAKKDYRKLAQDLVTATRDYRQRVGEFPDGTVVSAWIASAFASDAERAAAQVGDLIHRVYPKRTERPAKITPELAAGSAALLRRILTRGASVPAAAPDADADPEADDEQAAAPTSGAALSTMLMDELNRLLARALPKLEGDPIIQIGTTVHRFGSDEIIYKHIATLNSCTAIAEADVECYKTEAEMLLGWKGTIQGLDPDILTGYNIFGFDMSYIWDRVCELGIEKEFSQGLGRLKNRRTDLIEQRLSSSALGENILRYFDLDGIVMIDMLKVMQRDHKLDSFKLDHVAKVFLGDQKDDLRPREIFERYLGGADDRAVIARYCIQDCSLVNRLMQKLKVLENNIGMGNVCSVPLSYLFMRGQGVKIFSLVAKECRANGYLVPVINRYDTANDRDIASGAAAAEEAPEIDDGYEGAIVLDPEEGIYLDDPITVLDYSSLYPSSMIARNLSHDCFVNDDKYLGLEDQGITYLTVTYDNYKGVGDKKEKTGTTSCTFAQLPNGQKGIIPSILMKLLQQRKNTRKKIEYERLVLADGRIATGLVRELGTDDQLEILNVDQANLGQGFGGHKAIINASEVVSRAPAFAPFEQAVLDALQLAYKVTANSLYGQIGARTSPIYWKEIAACTTATGREMIITAKNFVEQNYQAKVIYGDSVTGHTPILVRDRESGDISCIPIARLAAGGSASGSGQWAPYREFLPAGKEQHPVLDYEVWTDQGWRDIVRVIRHRCKKRIFLVSTPRGCVEVTEDHSLMTAEREEIRPTELAQFPSEPLLYSFPKVPRGAPMLTGQKPVMVFHSAQEAQEEYIYLRGLGHSVSLSARSDPTTKSIVYRLALNCEITPADEIATVTDVSWLYQQKDVGGEGILVYDIETTEGVFQAGVGELIVKNTDSIFCRFENRDPDGNVVKGREALPYAIQAGQTVSRQIKAILPPPQCLEYEKTFYPFIILSKKRYVGNLYEDDPNKKPKQKSMGIVLKRRDNAPIVKRLYGGIIDIMLNRNDLAASVRFLKDELQKLVEGKVPLEDLIISKTLRNDYKDPTKIAHKVLADRMGARDPGNKPMVNDRIPFVYIWTGGPDDEQPKLQGDRIEHPDYIRENGLRPDYRFYITNQLMKPICQIYALCVEQIEGYDRPPEYWLQWEIELEGSPIYSNPKKRKDRITALRMREAEDLIFSPYLAQLGGTAPARKRRTAPRAGGTTAADPYELHIQVVEMKKVGTMRCEAFYGASPFLARDITKNKKRSITKHFCFIQFLEEVIVAICGAQDAFQDATERGVVFRVNDRTFVTLWNKARKQHTEEANAAADAIKNNDIGAIAEMNELVRLRNLMNALATLPYQVANGFVAPPSPS